MAAIAAQAGSQLVLGPNGQMRASVGQILSTPSVLAIIGVIFVVILCLILAGAAYWHAEEDAKKLHPNSFGYGKWYFTLYIRVWVSVALSVLTLGTIILGIFLVFAIPGPLLAQAHITAQNQGGEQKAVFALEKEAIAVANAKSREASEQGL